MQLYDVEAERAVLGTMLVEPSVIPQAMGVLKEEDFYVPEHRELYTAILTLFRERKTAWDDIVLLEKLKHQGSSITREFVFQLAEDACPLSTFADAVRIVKETSIRRKVHEYMTRKVVEIQKNGTSLVEIISDLKQILVSTTVLDSRNAYELAVELLQNFSTSQPACVYTTGYASIDSILEGILLPQYIIIASRPRVGKTSLMLNLALRMTLQHEDLGVLIVSLEMSQEELIKRLMSIVSGVKFSKIKNEVLNEEEKERIREALENRKGLDRIRIIHKPDMDVYELEAQIVRHMMEHSVRVVMVDYIQKLMMGGVPAITYERLSQVSIYLSNIAKRHSAVIMALAQISREVEKSRKDRRPTLGDIKGTGQLEQDADVVLLLHREALYTVRPSKEEEKKLEVIVAKNRHGATGTAYLIYDLDTQRIEDTGEAELGYREDQKAQNESKETSDEDSEEEIPF